MSRPISKFFRETLELAGEPNPSVETGRNGSKTRDVLSEGVPHQDAGIFDIDAPGKFRVAVITHQHGIIRRDRVEVLVAYWGTILQSRRDEPLSFRLCHIQLHSKPADTHDRPAEDAFDLSSAQPHCHESGFRRKDLQHGTAGDRTLADAGSRIRGVDQRDRRAGLCSRKNRAHDFRVETPAVWK